MKHPKLKHARLCQVMIPVTLLGPILLVMILAMALPMVQGGVKIGVLFGGLILMLAVIFHEFATLMVMHIALGLFAGYRTARTKYDLPDAFSPEAVTARLQKFGTALSPKRSELPPDTLRYLFRSPATVYSCGTERVVLSYRIPVLDADTLQKTLEAAKAHSAAVSGTKKARILDSQQKQAPLNRCTVVLLLADRVDVTLSLRLHEELCKFTGDEDTDVLMPCVIDLTGRCCVFDSFPSPGINGSITAKNRGIALIRDLVFGGKPPYKGNRNYLKNTMDMDPEMSLWEYWAKNRREARENQQQDKQLFASLHDREIRHVEDGMFIRWGEHGVVALCTPTEDVVYLHVPEFWDYGRDAEIPPETLTELTAYAVSDWESRGRRVELLELSDFLDRISKEPN